MFYVKLISLTLSYVDVYLDLYKGIYTDLYKMSKGHEKLPFYQSLEKCVKVCDFELDFYGVLCKLHANK